MHRLLVFFVLLLGIVFIAACNGANEITQQEQVASGETVYNDDCARCHDPEGIGPELRESNLSDYGTAHGLFNYIRRTMPQDNPGTLSEDEYYDVTAYILAREDMLPGDTVVSPETAEDISITE